MTTQKCSYIWTSLLVSLAGVGLLLKCFQPQWETNDDVAMSMVAHGYGLATTGSPNLVFSNVLWGHLVRSIPQLAGLWGYSIASISVLVVASWVVVSGLRARHWGLAVCVLVFSIIFSRPVLFPQFTINAGLLTVGAIVCWVLYGSLVSRALFVVGCGLALGGCLIRSLEFFLVMIVAMPLLPWRQLFKDRFARAVAFILIASIGFAWYFDQHSYRGGEWTRFNELNLARLPFTDFGAAEILKQQPHLISRHNFSANDIDLVARWFFVDRIIANPDALAAMLRDAGPLAPQSGSLAKGWAGIHALAKPGLLPICLAALALTALYPSRGLWLSWMVCIGVFFAIGVSGRPGVVRIYVPVVSLLLVAPLLRHSMRRAGSLGARRNIAVAILCISSLWNGSIVFSDAEAAGELREEVRRDLEGFPSESTVVWGAAFPFEAAYPVLLRAADTMKYRLYGLGVFTLAPFSTATFEEESGRGMLSRLLSPQGVPVLAGQLHVSLLDTYCKEHFGGQLRELAKNSDSSLHPARFACLIRSSKVPT